MEPVKPNVNATESVQPDPTIRGHLDDPITAHMRRDFSRVYVDQTVGEALDSIRKQSLDGRVIYFYVLDDEDRLRGVVPTRRLLLSGIVKWCSPCWVVVRRMWLPASLVTAQP